MRFAHTGRHPRKYFINKILAWLLVVLLLAMMAGCAARGRLAGDVADLTRLPQVPSWYQARVPGADWALKSSFQSALAKEWRQRWFEPWLKPDPAAGWQRIKADGEHFLENPGYGEAFLARGNPYYQALIENCSWQKYPNDGWNGITTKAIDLRLLPSLRPTFSAEKGSEGFPFDRLQQTSLPPNTPIYVHHHSKDKAWLLVQSPLAWGWMEANQAARMSHAQTEQFTGADLLAITKDSTSVMDMGNVFLFKAGLGAVLSLAGKEKHRWMALVASKNHKGRAVLHTSQLDIKSAERFPLEMSDQNISRLADGIMGQNYGWGGLYGNRDCSATLRDLFAPFGLWLPRNSFDQAHKVGRFVDLSGLEADQKKQALLDEGIPFLSLVWMEGHIMLYIGAWQEEPLVMHNTWGLRTQNGPAIIGRLVITTLEPGKERKDLVRPEGILINRVAGMTLLAPPKMTIKNK
jgi:cell wall-associated NlpC family hydrolase